jgi:hypothetical protein
VSSRSQSAHFLPACQLGMQRSQPSMVISSQMLRTCTAQHSTAQHGAGVVVVMVVLLRPSSSLMISAIGYPAAASLCLKSGTGHCCCCCCCCASITNCYTRAAYTGCEDHCHCSYARHAHSPCACRLRSMCCSRLCSCHAGTAHAHPLLLLLQPRLHGLVAAGVLRALAMPSPSDEVCKRLQLPCRRRGCRACSTTTAASRCLLTR